MKDLASTEEFRVNFLERLIDPHIPNSGKMQRARASPTKIKALYHLFQLNKNIISGKWKSGKNVQGKKLIAKNANISVKHFSEFVNSGDFEFLGKVTHRKHNTNIYELEKWVVDLFYFFEKKGMMKHFRHDFEKWRKIFLKRVNNWLLPLLRKGYCLQQILINNLIDKNTLKGGDPNILKGGAIKPKALPSRDFHKALQGYKTKQRISSLPSLQKLCEVSETLIDRFQIKEGDLNMIIKSFSLKQIEDGIRIRENYRIQGFLPRSPIASFIHCLKKSQEQEPKWK